MRCLIFIAVLGWLIAANVQSTAVAQTIPGSSLALKSRGSGTGNWTLDRNGYVGTYINCAVARERDGQCERLRHGRRRRSIRI